MFSTYLGAIGLNVFVPPKTTCQNPEVQCGGIRRQRACSKWLDHGGGALVSEMNALMNMMLQSSLASCTMWEHSEKLAVFNTKEELLAEPDHAGTLIFQLPEL